MNAGTQYKPVRGDQPPERIELGARVHGDRTHFALFSRHATRVTLFLYDDVRDVEPAAKIRLDPARDRFGDLWYVRVEGVGHGQPYLYRVDGPSRPIDGHRFSGQHPVFDPYARAFGGDDLYERPILPGPVKCLVVGDSGFDWEGDRPLRTPIEQTVIYEAHVRGFTHHSSSGVSAPGTYAGFAEKVPYLKELGVTAVELLPIHEFSVYDSERIHPVTGLRLTNFWGYNTVGFFAPHGAYAADPAPGRQVDEFRALVKALHRAGIEVILDVVYNHTAEGNERGKTLSFRGIDNSVYYLLEADKRRYANYSGVGNTVNANHPVVRRMIVDSLRFWVQRMHVDGFRFDLASILNRGRDGHLGIDSPLVDEIAEDPVLRDTKIIAEAWDAAGAYQVGGFSRNPRWAEWNGSFRDDVRRFWRGDLGLKGGFASRLAGSQDVFGPTGRGPLSSINFVTSHDGYTLADLVAYEQKHNQANAEDNRDGDNNNHSRNYGVEGPTDDRKIASLRERQRKNMLASLLLSVGVPMVLAGDELGRTQQGNNNAYCQDNEISWIDWRMADGNAAFLRFCREMVAFRHRHPALQRRAYYRGDDADGNGLTDIAWFDPDGNDPEWFAGTGLIGCVIDGAAESTGALRDDDDLCMLFNATDADEWFLVPDTPTGRQWYMAINTFQQSPNDVRESGRERAVVGPHLLVHRYSLIVLLGR